MMTAMLSLQAAGAWMKLRMYLQTMKSHFVETSVERLAVLLRCQPDTLLTVLKEFELSITCGFKVEWPPGYDTLTDKLRLTYEPDEKTALLKTSEVIRVSSYEEKKRKSETKRMPEEWSLTPRMQAIASRYGMTTATMEHQFERCRLHHLEAEFTEIGWEWKVWSTWVLRWVEFGKNQITNGSCTDPSIPPFPGPHDHIARQAWRLAYGDPKNPKVRST